MLHTRQNNVSSAIAGGFNRLRGQVDKLTNKPIGHDAGKTAVTDLFARAGVSVNGSAPHDITVHNTDFYARLLNYSDLGLGESYLDGWWDCEQLDTMIAKLLRAQLHRVLKGNWQMRARVVKGVVLNLQNRKRATKSARAHYDIGNDLYEIMLDKRMQYTCAYWKNAENLDDAQEAKLHLVCKKLGLQSGMRVLELGCGFGGLAKFAAEHYGVEVTAYNVSKAQLEIARERATGLPVTFHLRDYREAYGQYDAVVSVGMMEHIGYKNHRALINVIERCMTDEAVALVHTIGSNNSRVRADAFVDRYLFPNAVSPSIAQMGKALEGKLIMEDCHNFGPDYDPTLMAWWNNFKDGYHKLDQDRYDQRFWRLWRYYLLAAAGSSRARHGQLWHWVLTKQGRTVPEARYG